MTGPQHRKGPKEHEPPPEIQRPATGRFTQRVVEEIWRKTRSRRKPWALLDIEGKLYVQQADKPIFEGGTLLGVYLQPRLQDLREDLMETSRG